MSLISDRVLYSLWRQNPDYVPIKAIVEVWSQVLENNDDMRVFAAQLCKRLPRTSNEAEKLLLVLKLLPDECRDSNYFRVRAFLENWEERPARYT